MRLSKKGRAAFTLDEPWKLYQLPLSVSEPSNTHPRMGSPLESHINKPIELDEETTPGVFGSQPKLCTFN